MMVYLNWTKAAILYEDEFGLIRLQDLVRSPPSKNAELYIRQTVPSNYRYDNYVVYRIVLVDHDIESEGWGIKTIRSAITNDSPELPTGSQNGCMLRIVYSNQRPN